MDYDSFEQGSRFGVNLTTEVYIHKIGISDGQSGMPILL